MHPQLGVHRETLVEHIWPDTSTSQANQCLNTLTHLLKSQLSDALDGQAPIIHMQSRYSLNLASGLRIDVLEFESAIEAGHRLLSAGSTSAVISHPRRLVGA